MRFRSIFTITTSMLFVMCVPVVAFACNPALATVCQRYERAEAIFIGTLKKTEIKDELHLYALYATFEVRESFKGLVGKTETVKFGASDCDPKIDKIGEVYFVYKDPYSRVPLVANYTHVLTKKDEDLEFAKNIDLEHPVFRIGGILPGFSESEVRKARIFVSDGGNKKEIYPDAKGWFEYLAKNKGSYEVTIEVPFVAILYWEQQKSASAITEGRSLTYQVDFRPNGCDVREINISAK